jgi:hypothetical protein
VNNRRFFGGMVIGVAGTAALFIAAYFLLSEIGELNIGNVVKRQQSDALVLFSSGINQDVFDYKLRLFEEIKPDVVVIGSSRALQIRAALFNRRFVNLGGAVGTVIDLQRVAKRLSASTHKPELALIFLDPWWFNERYPRIFAEHAGRDFALLPSVSLLFQAVRRIPIRRISAEGGRHYFGIAALTTGDGYTGDGSYHYTSIISGARGGDDIAFAETLQRIKESTRRFETGTHASGKALAYVTDSVDLLEKAGIRVILIAPPFAAPVWREMQRTRGYAYIAEDYRYLSEQTNVSLFDFSDAATISGSSDCEFVDGFHGGDTTYARILLDVAAKSPALENLLAGGYVKQFIRTYDGYAGGGTLRLFPDLKEMDFLRIGCRKSVSTTSLALRGPG